MVLYIIGLGLGSPSDITVRGLECIGKCEHIYLEAYTSLLPNCSAEKLTEYYQSKTNTTAKVIVADREDVEQRVEELILEKAQTQHVAFLVVGDPFGATTHTDLVLRGKEMKIETVVVHNASIMNAVAVCGLQLYKFGQTVSLCFWSENWQPDSYYEKIVKNMECGLHTLALLDIKVKEPTQENMCSGGKIKTYLPPRFMTIREALEQLQQVENKYQNGIITPDTLFVGLARVGCSDSEDQRGEFIKAGTLQQLLHETSDEEWGGPLHSLVIASRDCHFLELDSLRYYGASVTASDDQH
jgi:diphthine synthase